MPQGKLTGNHLKLIAAGAMLLDHAGILLFPGAMLFRILGRLAYPIYAFMIAEGCRYTRRRLRYFLSVFGLGAACQLVYLIVGGDTYLNILLTFSVSIGLCFLYQCAYEKAGKHKGLWQAAFYGALLMAVVLSNELTIDYGLWGMGTPLLVYGAGTDRARQLGHMALGLVLLALNMGGIQWWSLLALPLLALYNGQRGKYRMKYFFYLFYPAHLAILQVIAWLI